ncbi:universal stress protein UspF [Limnobaculum zhutongyuii]|uniref:Universal stress protein F n=1 Tax=Limnobaculum zhutongyuii TaxID=2498113 RepID=A0A411WQD7_9GAMM|nr:universal stress protein UspF [Limnobaculum zhutongyuii]QBH98431.1 universal stress protein UspF [Limnobaculum zhutongyuii]TQS89671.1 universal stress protein UspF [Limnobaculum zhutongyuii]
MYHTILVPIDISTPELTQLVVPHVKAQVSLNDNARVHFLTVIPIFPYYASLGLAYSPEAPDNEMIRSEALSQLTEAIKPFNIPKSRMETHLATGSPKDRILGLAESIQADIIIVASHRPSMATYLLGSNAAAIVRYAKCPVLVIR